MLGCFVPCHGCIDNAIHSAAGLQLRRSCLELAVENKLRSIAFCCISTGEFRFPNARAAELAVETVKNFRSVVDNSIEVVFNVFKDSDLIIYEKILGGF